MGLMGSWGWNLTAVKGEERRGRGRGGRGEEAGKRRREAMSLENFFLR